MSVDYACLFPTPMLGIGTHPDPEVEAQLCGAYNRWLIEDVIPASNGRFYTMLSLPISEPDAALRQVEKYGGSPHISGFMITAVRTLPVHHNALMKVYRAIEERGLSLSFHSGINTGEAVFKEGGNRLDNETIFSWVEGRTTRLAGALAPRLPDGFRKLGEIRLGPNGLVANHYPFVLDRAGSPLGTLRAHMARANDQWKHLDGEREALVIFQGVDAYITPTWYATKAETQKAVPTWNYTIVHVYGTPRIVDDAAWLERHVTELTNRHEGSQPEPWQVTDAPADFIASMLKAIVGIELVISRIEGKTKASQNRPEIDRAGVIQGLSAQADERSIAMAELVEGAGKR